MNKLKIKGGVIFKADYIFEEYVNKLYEIKKIV